MITVKVKTQGFQKVMTELNGMNARAFNLREPLTKSIPDMLRSIDTNFRAGGRPPWQPLAPSTLYYKLKRGLSPTPLTGRTGRLRSQITGQATDNRLTIGTSIKYAKYHQFGTRHIPMRKFLMFQREDLERIALLVKKHILGKT